MKSNIYKALLLSGLVAVNAEALSLYDSTPVVGIPESHAIQYNVGASVGYDTNRGSSYRAEESSAFVSASVGASYADYESTTNLVYSFSLGLQKYLKSSSSGDNQDIQSNCSLSASLTHAISGGSNYAASLSLSYSPEPDYASGYSSAHRQGDCLNWSFSNSYSQSIDARWSWNVSAGYSGNIYGERKYSQDDRQYVSGGLGLSYRASELMSYNASMSYRYDARRMGFDSDNVTFSLGFTRSLDPVSSCSGSVGLQTKMVGNDTILNPNFHFGYNRTVSEGLSVSTFVNFSNENVDTYRGMGANYLSDLTWRVGVNCSYRLSPVVSFNFGLSCMHSTYSKGTGNLQKEKNMTLNPSVGMSYRFSEKLSGNINYQYTWYDSGRKGSGDYTRHSISSGLQYSF